jgi:hypothetical protein
MVILEPQMTIFVALNNAVERWISYVRLPGPVNVRGLGDALEAAIMNGHMKEAAGR